MKILRTILKRFKLSKENRERQTYESVQSSFLIAKNNYREDQTNNNRLNYLNLSNSLRDLENLRGRYSGNYNEHCNGILTKINKEKIEL